MKKLLIIFIVLFLTQVSYSQDIIEWPLGAAAIKLIWEPSTDNITPQDSLVYEILDSMSIIGTISPGDTSFVIFRPDSGLYHFGVLAIDADGNRSNTTFLDSLIYVSYINTKPPSTPQRKKTGVDND